MRKSSKKGDIAVGTIAALLIAAIAIALFLTLVFLKFPSLSKSIYCKTISPIKIFFFSDSSEAEESYCAGINELSGKMLSKENIHERYFYDTLTSKRLDFESGTEMFSIKLPKANITYAEMNVSGFLYENQTRFSDSKESQVLAFSGTEEKEISITIPKKAHVISASMNISGNKTAGSTNVLVFKGYQIADDVESYLDHHGISYDEETVWKDKLDKYSILFVGCGEELVPLSQEDKAYITNWISNGNTLVATCWAINLIVDLFGRNPVGSVPSDGWTPFITRITPYQDFPALSNPDIWEVCNKCGSDTCRYCEENYITCQEDIGVGGQCGDSQRIRFTEFAAKNYGVKEGDIVEIPYSGSHCFYVTTPGNPEVNVIAELVYDPYENNPKDEDIKLKCAQNNNGDPGESIVEFKYREGTVIYMAMHIDAQIDNELGKTDFLRNAINSRLPKVSNITITVKESQFIEWNYPGSLEKPANAKLNIKGINDALEKCNSDMCEIKIKINATNGIMLINNLLIEYHLPVYDVKMNVGGNEINIAENLNDSNSPLYLNKSIREGINNYLLSCNEKECIVPFEMEMREKGSIVLSALNVEYQKCLVKEEIIAHTLACWEKSGFGKSGNDISCYEISIPESCGFVEDLKEAEFTDSLKQNGLCEEIGNNGFDEECGKSDSIDFKLMKTAPGRNIFIKYSAEKAKVIII